MRIAHLSDSHLSADKPARAAELEACIRAINALQPAPDVVVHTGDIAHDGKLEEYMLARQLLDDLTAPYFVLAGNRDNRQHLIEAFADGHHVKMDMDYVQYVVEDFAVRLIMLDTLSGTSNKGRLCKARLDHAECLMAADPSKPSAVFLHHPPFRVTVGPDPKNFEVWAEAEALMALMLRQSGLLGLYCGHVHRAFETSIVSRPACVVSSIASDLRWDRTNGPTDHLPMFKIRDLPMVRWDHADAAEFQV